MTVDLQISRVFELKVIAVTLAVFFERPYSQFQHVLVITVTGMTHASRKITSRN